MDVIAKSHLYTCFPTHKSQLNRNFSRLKKPKRKQVSVALKVYFNHYLIHQVLREQYLKKRHSI